GINRFADELGMSIGKNEVGAAGVRAAEVLGVVSMVGRMIGRADETFEGFFSAGDDAGPGGRERRFIAVGMTGPFANHDRAARAVAELADGDAAIVEEDAVTDALLARGEFLAGVQIAMGLPGGQRANVLMAK